MVCRLMVENRVLKKVFSEAAQKKQAANSVTICTNLPAALGSQNWEI